ncbi:MAG TPA: hypothetical protein VL486_13070 [Verrucomicrobiae bacterium]|nr:hypothetical protein [Verrucomicrobiae bacterium]
MAPKLLIPWGMTLLREIQLLLERTYGPTGVNLEKFLLTPSRNRTLSEMAGTSAAQISDLGRVFLRVANENLRLGIHYDSSVVEALEERNPAYGLNDDNILPFMVFIEELDHAVHAALKFREGVRDIHNETFVRDLELQAKVDTYLILQKYCAFFNNPPQVTDADRRWLRACVFDHDTGAFEDPRLARRYRETNRLARRYAGHLDRLSPKRRTAEIRHFRKLAYNQKRDRIAALRPH